MLTSQDIKPLLKKYGLLKIEVDERHLALINEVFCLGVNTGINQAKESLAWRINGDLMVKMIEENICP